jgi:hypothetical protein
MTNTAVGFAEKLPRLAISISRRAAFERAARKLKKDGRAFVMTAPVHSKLAHEYKLRCGGLLWGRDGCVTNSACLEDFAEAMGVLRPFERIATRKEEIAAGKSPRY